MSVWKHFWFDEMVPEGPFDRVKCSPFRNGWFTKGQTKIVSIFLQWSCKWNFTKKNVPNTINTLCVYIFSTSSVSGHSFEVKSPRRWTNPTPWLSGFPRGNLQPITIRSSSQNDNMCHSFTKHSFLKLWGSGWICMNPRHKPVRLTGHLPEVQNLQGVACLKPHRQVNWPNAIHTGKAKQTKTKHWLDQQILYLISPIAIY